MQSASLPQLVQAVPNPSPGFSQAAGWPTVVVWLSQPHSPPAKKFMKTATETQYVPGSRRVRGTRIENVPVPLSRPSMNSMSATTYPVRPFLILKNVTHTEFAGPEPLK